MAHQEFRINDIAVRYFKDDNLLFVAPDAGTDQDKVSLLKNQLETFLQVDSIKTQNNGISMKLDKGMSSVPEFLRSLGAEGGEEIEDAESVSQEESEDDAQEAQEQPMPGAGMAPPPPQPGMPLAAGLIPKVYMMLYENAFGATPTFGKPKKPGRRTGKYWKPIEAATGKNRSKILDQDVLHVRKIYSQKPASDKRNAVLRSLDKAFNYFFGKLSEAGGRAVAEKYADDYYAVDDLDPKDYSLEAAKPEPIGPDEPMPPPDPSGLAPDEMNGPDFMDFADVLDRDDDSYDDIEVDEEIRL